MSTKLLSVVEYAKQNPNACLTSINRALTVDLLVSSFRELNRKAASGVDGETWTSYGQNLRSNAESLLARVHGNQYRASPVRRVIIPKPGDAAGRPLGIPIIEDRLLQRAVLTILEPIFEVNFNASSFGFRPEIGPLTCIKAIDKELHRFGGGYVIDADIRKYFDNIDHAMLMELFKRRVNDGIITGLIGKWLKAQILSGVDLLNPTAGSPQGGVISPLLANIYLHHVLDLWMEVIKPRSKGRIRLFRYCDDFIIICSERNEAELLMSGEKGLPDRLKSYHLELHPEKTRLVDFRRGSKETFCFLGLRFYWGQSRTGRTIPKLRSDGNRMRRKMIAIHQLCRSIRHWSLKDQHRRLSEVMIGYRGYYGISFNYNRLSAMFDYIEQTWRYWLRRRGGKKYFGWKAMDGIFKKFPLPEPKIIHRLF